VFTHPLPCHVCSVRLAGCLWWQSWLSFLSSFCDKLFSSTALPSNIPINIDYSRLPAVHRIHVCRPIWPEVHILSETQIWEIPSFQLRNTACIKLLVWVELVLLIILRRVMAAEKRDNKLINHKGWSTLGVVISYIDVN